MNKRVKTQDLEKLLVLDIETVSRNKELELDTKEFELFQWKHRNKETDEFLENSELQDLYKRKAALDPVFNKIVCISVGYIKNNILYYKSFRGEQKDIINKFYTILNSGNFIPCGHNIISFDMPVTRLKAFEEDCEVELLDKFTDSQKKPWDMTSNFMDTMEITKGTYYYNLSLDDMCYLAGIESPKNEISGKDVTYHFYNVEGGLDKIVEYCERDIIACANLICSLAGKKDYIKEVICKNEVEIKELSLLERLYEENYLSEDLKEKLSKLLKKKKVLKKDKEIIKDIILSCYIHDNFEIKDQDSKKIKLQKEEEVNEFIESL